MDAWLALAGTIFGGAGLYAVQWLFGRRKRKEDTATSLRTELRLELATMRTEMERLRREADLADQVTDQWRARYFALVAAYSRGEHDQAEKIIRGQ